MSNRYFWYDGDTTYEPNWENGKRLAGAQAPEMKHASGATVRDAAALANRAGYEPTGMITRDIHGREVHQFADGDNNTLAQALVNTGMASPMHGEMAHGVSPHAAAARDLTGAAPQGIENNAAFQFLAEQARSERLQAIDQFVQSGIDKNVLPLAADPRETRGLADRAWDRGVDNMQATFYGFTNAIGEAAGIDVMAEWGEEGMARNIFEAMASPATVGTYEDIDSLADAGIYALEALVEFSPQLAMDASVGLASGGAGAVLSRTALAGIGKSVLRKAGGEAAVAGAKTIAGQGLATSAFAKGAKAGAFASMYAQNAGETQMNFKLEDIDAPGTALAVGVGKAALDYAGLSAMMRGAVKGLGKDAVTPETMGQLLRNVGEAAGFAMAAESVTEATQTLMDELAIMSFKPEHEINWTEIIDAGLKGGIAGGGVGGAGRAVSDLYRMGQDGYEAGLPGANDPAQDTLIEPVRDIEAQLDSTPQGEGRWFTRENAEQARTAAAERGLSTRENPDGSVFVGDQALLDTVPAEPTQADIARVTGYEQTKDEAMADPEGTVVVEARREDGAVLRNQLVGKSIAEAVRAKQQQKFPDAVVEVKEAVDTIEQRVQAVEQEQKQTEIDEIKARMPESKLAERDPAELVALATERGIDPSRFQKKGLGDAVVNRLEGGLKANVPGNKQRRLDNVEVLASVLGMPPEQLRREYYDSRNVINGRDQLFKAIQYQIQEKFGGDARAITEAIDALPVAQTEVIRTELGLTEQGGFDIGALVAEIEMRAPERTLTPMEQAREQDGTAPWKPQNAPLSTEADARAGKPTPDGQLVESLIEHPGVRSVLFGEGNQPLTGDLLDESIEKMPFGKRVALENHLKKLDISIGGKNREMFLKALYESVGEQASYGIGKRNLDETNPDSQAFAVEQTVEFDPSALDSEGVRIYEQVLATPLEDTARNGWPAGLSLYLDAIARIAQADQRAVEGQSKLSENEGVTLGYARAMAAAIAAFVKSQPMLNQETLLLTAAEVVGVNDALVAKAAGAEVSVGQAMEAFAGSADGRVGKAIQRLIARQLDPEATDAENIEAVVEALGQNPEQTLRDIHDWLYKAWGDEGFSSLEQVVYFERNRVEESETQRITATSKGHDAGQGADNVAIDYELAENEQAASDATFFAAVRRYSIDKWRAPVLPPKERIASLVFRDAIAKEITTRFDGANLLVMFDHGLEGTMLGRVVDAVSLSRYGEKGMPAPATAVDALHRLLDNLDRLMAGPQNSHAEAGSVAIVRNIPDSLVIYVDPVTGEGVTYGQALNREREALNARARQVAIGRELDQATDRLNELSEALDATYGSLTELAQRDLDVYPGAKRAVSLWQKMLAGEKRNTGNKVDYYKKPPKKGPGAEPDVRAAMDKLGRQPVDGLDMTLDEAFGEYLSTLGNIKRLNEESAVLKEGYGAKREAPEESAAIASELRKQNRGVFDANDPVDQRAVKEAERAGMGRFADDEASHEHAGNKPMTLDDYGDPEYNAYAQDPLSGLSAELLLDGEDKAQDAAIKAWLEARKKGGLTSAGKGGPAFFRREAVVIAETAPAKGMTKAKVDAVVEAFKAAYNGNIPLTFRVEQSQKDVYGEGAVDDEGNPLIVKGAYHPTGRSQRAPGTTAVLQYPGRVVLIAENLENEADVLATLRHEVFGHFGLNTFSAAVKRQILDAISASRDMPGLRKLWAKIDRTYADKTESERAEEVFAYVAEQERFGLKALYDQVLNWLATAARKMGMLDGQVTRAELATMAKQIAGGVRDGKVRQRTWPQSDAEQFRRSLPSSASLIGQGKRFWKNGAAPMLRTVGSMVHTRIAQYSPELSLALFQPAGKRAAKSGRSFEQASRALSGRMMSQVDKVLGDIQQATQGNKLAKQQALRAAFRDAYSGKPQTIPGKRIRTLVDNLVTEAQTAGLRSVKMEAGFAPMAFDRRTVNDKRAEFEALLVQHLQEEGNPVDAKRAREIVTNIVEGPGVLEGTIAPGMPVGMHLTTDQIVKAIGMDKLMQAGWMLDAPEAALFHWVSGVSKRAAWEASFGDYLTDKFVEVDGKIQPQFSPNAKFHKALDKVREQHGDTAAKEIVELVNGALGRHPAGQSMPGWFRTTQEFITGWVGMTVLAFSGIASIPELTLPLVRAGGRVGISSLFTDHQQSKRFARDMGIVLSDSSEQVMWQMTGDQYQSPLISKMQSTFFKYNGNAWIIKTSRTLATGIGIRYLLNAAADGDTGALQRLNIDAGTVHAWDQAGRPTWSPDQDEATQAIAAAVTDAVSQFVNEATLNPSRFQSTHWGNNPYFKMIWHLKHFLYTYGDTVLGGIYREMRRRFKHLDPTEFNQAVAIAAPALLFAVAVMPLAAAALEARDWVRYANGQRASEYNDALEYFGAVFDRAGGLGPVEFLLNMREQQERGMSVFGALAPVPGKVDMLFSTRTNAEYKMRQMVPVWSQNKTLFGLLE